MKMFHSRQFLGTVILKISKIILFVTVALHKYFIHQTLFSSFATQHPTCHCNLQGQHSGINYPLIYDLGLGHK